MKYFKFIFYKNFHIHLFINCWIIGTLNSLKVNFYVILFYRYICYKYISFLAQLQPHLVNFTMG